MAHTNMRSTTGPIGYQRLTPVAEGMVCYPKEQRIRLCVTRLVPKLRILQTALRSRELTDIDILGHVHVASPRGASGIMSPGQSGMVLQQLTGRPSG